MALWTPAEIPTLLWLDAADAATITEVSGAVSQWDDKSGNTRHAAQGTASARPVVTSAAMNGLDIIQLDGVNDLMTIASTIPASAGVELFFVVRQNESGASRNGALVQFSDVTASSAHFGGGADAPQDWYEVFYSTARVQIPGATVPPDDYFGSVRHTGTAIEGHLFAELVGSVASTFDGTPSNRKIGGDASPGQYTEMGYGELVLVQSPDTDTRQLIQGYQAWRWGLEDDLPVGHPYKDGAPVTDPIIIDTQPEDDSVIEGQDASFTVVAGGGTGTIVYQWKRGEDDSDIAGANSATYEFETVLADNGRTFYVTVSDDESSVDSDTVTLTVSPAMSISTQPTNQTAEIGEEVTFSVAIQDADGTVSHQWYEVVDGSPVMLAGETSSSLVFTATEAEYNSFYFVEIDDTITFLTSNVVSLFVSIPKTYGLDLGGQRGPIYRRGTIVLDSPISKSEGTGLLIRRKTPITNDFLAEAFLPFQPEQFEHQVDRYIMILQEIEGDACACPPTYEVPGGIDPGAFVDVDGEIPDECFPYDCAAFDKKLNSEQMVDMRVYSLLAGEGDHPNPFDGSIWRSASISTGTEFTWPGDTTDSVLVGSGVVFDPCGGAIQRIFRWDGNGTFGNAGHVIMRDTSINTNTFIGVIKTKNFTNTDGSGRLMSTGRNYIVGVSGDPDFGVFRPVGTLFIRKNSGVMEVQVSPIDSGVWHPLGAVADTIFASGNSITQAVISFAVRVGNPGYILDTEPLDDIYRYTINYAYRLNIRAFDDQGSLFEVDYESGESGYVSNSSHLASNGPPSFSLASDNTPTTMTKMFENMLIDFVIFSGIDTTLDVDMESFVTAFYRNRLDYETPDWCPI